MVWDIDEDVPGIKLNRLNTSRPGTVNHYGLATNTTITSVTLTSAQVQLGYVANTAGTVTMTLPTGTLLGALVGAVQGTTMDLFIDNTGSAFGAVTMAVGANGILSDAANTTSTSFGQLTVTPGATGIGQFKIMFSSSTAYVFTRVA